MRKVVLPAVLAIAVVAVGQMRSLQMSATAARQLHSEATAAVAMHGKSVDDPVAGNLKQTLKTNGLPEDVRYRDVLQSSEATLSRVGTPVTVVVDSSPNSCPVEYQPIAGGPSNDFGTTRAQKKIAPKTYEFRCRCSGAVLKKIVDCTDEGTSVKFDCGK